MGKHPYVASKEIRKQSASGISPRLPHHLPTSCPLNRKLVCRCCCVLSQLPHPAKGSPTHVTPISPKRTLNNEKLAKKRYGKWMKLGWCFKCSPCILTSMSQVLACPISSINKSNQGNLRPNPLLALQKILSWHRSTGTPAIR